MNSSLSFPNDFNARNDMCGPSKTTKVFGSHEWFAFAASGSSATPIGSKVGLVSV